MRGRGIATRYVDLSVLLSSLLCLTVNPAPGFEHDARWLGVFVVQAFFLSLLYILASESKGKQSKQASVHTVVYLPTYLPTQLCMSVIPVHHVTSASLLFATDYLALISSESNSFALCFLEPAPSQRKWRRR